MTHTFEYMHEGDKTKFNLLFKKANIKDPSPSNYRIKKWVTNFIEETQGEKPEKVKMLYNRPHVEAWLNDTKYFFSIIHDLRTVKN